jgi:hypothetical protein
MYQIQETSAIPIKVDVSPGEGGGTWSRSGYACATTKSGKRGVFFYMEQAARKWLKGDAFFKSSLELS